MKCIICGKRFMCLNKKIKICKECYAQQEADIIEDWYKEGKDERIKKQ